ncbi:methyltransferase domain-containing protein [Micromonospora carbonacea]|uniref:methyltransferase domain-containing protein n=1 Tax=Micromonospora carbonacea TaxID=47853 RepID=UPI0015A93CE2|nr:methyltransferase domain-containing protein [Micromonospora carbonacea]
MVTVRFLARTLRGLEEVAAREVAGRGCGVEHQRHREVWFRASRPEPSLLDLRTVDDLFLLAGVTEDADHTKAALAAFTRLARDAPLRQLLEVRKTYGYSARAGTLDVAASFLGRRNYNRYDVEEAVGRTAAARLGLRFHSRRNGEAPPEGSLSLRVTVEGTQAALAVRIADRPLHRRSYKTSSTPGTLHPPLAAALAWLAGIRAGMRVVDPCCGTGTILLESGGLSPGAVLLGLDHDPAAVRAAVANAGALDGVRRGSAGGTPGVTWAVGDAGRLPLGAGTVDRVVSNPPWDRQVLARGALADDPARLFREIRRVLAADGLAVLLLHEFEELTGAVAAAGLGVDDVRVVSLFGTHPAMVTLSG